MVKLHYQIKTKVKTMNLKENKILWVIKDKCLMNFSKNKQKK